MPRSPPPRDGASTSAYASSSRWDDRGGPSRRRSSSPPSQGYSDRYERRPPPRDYDRQDGRYDSRGAGPSGREGPSSRPYDYGRDERSYGGRNERSDRYEPSGRRERRSPRSRSPDFARQRERERARYDAAAGLPPPAPGAGAPAVDEEAAKPNFERSGLLAAASNNVNGVALKYHEPPDSRKPKKAWRLYVFKDGKELELLHVSRQSCYLLGRDRTVVDIPVDHVSCSKQHAALQYRLIVERNEYGDEKRTVKPFIIDLESANGTTVNDQEIPPSRYYELKSGDTIQFGASSREYVLLAEE